MATSVGEVYVEQGRFSGRRRRSLPAAAAPLASVHSSANREQVLTRRLLSLEQDRNGDFVDSEHEATSNSFWPQSVSVYAVVGVLIVSAVLLVASVMIWTRRQQKSEHPF